MFGGRNRKTSTRTEIVNGKPVIRVKIDIEGNLLEKSSEQVTITEDVIKQIEQQLSKQGEKAYRDLIQKTQEKQSDIFGFGEHVRALQPIYWDREIKTKENWQQMYKDLAVDVSVKLHIRRVGMKAA
ncbi:Ger(x)C family spore germination C-terminal domain-containing protein [Gordoniibacillus kamchatkensis]|uniref:Ger(x)C family spore germination C-terminal domain-containing protein n=1 Tax=Gordoniibacillus kamchatkensis TaxID=1590651 RepID=UPI000AAB2C7A|nr:Ger(x)C family spore germination C-terminal domain-containing protein [Paenibacillus sp. VKM B-2647]